MMKDKYLNLPILKENVQNEKTKGAIVRSKAKFVEEGERNSQYFLNLDKRNYNESYIKLL